MDTEAILALAERAGPELRGLDPKPFSAQLEERHDDLLAALQRLVDERRVDEALAMASALAPFWTSSKRLDEGSDWFDRVLAVPGGDDATRGRACFEAGLVVFWTGDDERAAAFFREAVGSGDVTAKALGLTGLARIALRTDVEEARRLCREARDVTEGTGDRLGRSSALHVLAVAAQMAGDLDEARELMSERMELARELGSYLGISSEACNLSMVERQLGNVDRAEELARESLEIARRREDEWMYPYTLSSLAAIAVERGDHERAATLIGAAESMMEAQNAAWPPDERPHYEQTVARLSEAMGGEFERVRSAGRALTSSEAVGAALYSGNSSGWNA